MKIFMIRKKSIKSIIAFFLVPLIVSCAGMSGDFDMKTGDYDGAIKAYEKDILDNPANLRSMVKLGAAYYKAGRFNDSVNILESALKINPDDSDALYYLGLARLKQGKTGEAAKAWQKGPYAEKPKIRKELQKQLTLVETKAAMDFARKALAREAKLKAKEPDPGSVAVFYYKDKSKDKRFRYLEKALTEMIITDLSRVKSLKVVERLNIQYLLDEMEMGASGIVDKTTAPRAGRLLGAENLVTGSLEPGSILARTAVVSTKKRTVMASFFLSQKKEEFFKLQKKIVSHIINFLKIDVSPATKKIIGRYHTKSYKAAVYLGQAIDAKDKGKWKEARKFYALALKEDPNFWIAFWGHESCPDDSDPGIGSLKEMSPQELALLAEMKIDRAKAVQIRFDNMKSRIEDKDAGGSAEDSGVEQNGNISVSW